MNKNFLILIFLLLIEFNISRSNPSLTEKLFPVLELPKEIDGQLDPSLTKGLPTVVVRGFINYMTIVDGVVIKFTKSNPSGIKPTETFPVLLIPTSVESTRALVTNTNTKLFNETANLVVGLDKRTGHLQVSQVDNQFPNSSSIRVSTVENMPSTGVNYSSDNKLSATENLRMRMNRFKVKGADSDQLYDICLKDVCIRGKIPDSVLLVGKHKQSSSRKNTKLELKEDDQNDFGYKPPLPWRRRKLRKRMNRFQPTEAYIDTKTYTRTMKSQLRSTMSVVKDGTTKNHVVTDHFVITELVIAHKTMPHILRTIPSRPTMESKMSTMIKPTLVSPTRGISSTTYQSGQLINPVEYLVGLDMDLTVPLMESGEETSQSTFFTPPLPLPPPNLILL